MSGCVGEECKQGLVPGPLRDSGVNNTLLSVRERARGREREREWEGAGLGYDWSSRWLRVSSAVSMACSTTASLHAAHRCRSAN